MPAGRVQKSPSTIESRRRRIRKQATECTAQPFPVISMDRGAVQEARMNMEVHEKAARRCSDQRPALAPRRCPRRRRRRNVLLLGPDHRRVLPTLVRRTPAPPRERRFPPHDGRRRACRVSALPALQARRGRARATTAGDGRRTVPFHRACVGAPYARPDGPPGRAFAVAPASDLQARDRPHPQGVCGGTSCTAHPRRARAVDHGDGGDPWRGLRLQWPLLWRIRARSWA